MVSGSNRFLSIGAAAGSLALLAAVVLMLWPPDPGDYGFTPGRDRPDGETVGWVSKVEANTIHVNSGPFGGGVVPLVVTKTTRITVGTKDGWFEDIRPGGQVKVAYELYHGRRFARSVELLVGEGSRPPARPAPPLRNAAGVPAAPERVPTKVPSESTPDAHPTLAPKSAGPALSTPSAADVATPAPRPPTVAAKPAPPPPEVRPAPRPGPAPVRPQTGEVVPPSQRASNTTPAPIVLAPENGSRVVESVRSPVPAAPRPTAPARGTDDGEGTDGSAAVDWLLKSRR